MAGQRPDYKERMAQKRRSGAVIKLFYIVVIASGVGLAYHKRAELKSFYDNLTASKAPAPAVPPTVEKKEASEPPKEPVKAPIAEKKQPDTVSAPPQQPMRAAPAALPADVVKAQKVLDESKALFEEF